MLRPSSRWPTREPLLTIPETRLLALSLLLIGGVIAASTMVAVPHWAYRLALFGHLGFLLVGFGSVLAIDWCALWYVRGKASIASVLLQAHRLNPLIWLGLSGLVVTGAFLRPELDHPRTIVKMVCVLGIGVVGVLTLSTTRLMLRQLPDPPLRLMRRGAALAGASQSFWWTTVLIGFLTDGVRH